VEIDVAPDSIPESPYSTFWRSFITGALGGGLAMNVRAACMKWIHARFSGDFLKARAKSGCATAANAISALISGSIDKAWSGTVQNPDTQAALWGKALGGALIGTALWEDGFYTWLVDRMADAAVWLLVFARTTYTWVAPAVSNGARTVNEIVQKLRVNMGAILASVPAPTAASPPCDTYGYFGAPCAGAHSTTRALYSWYDGPLYQVQRASDNATADIRPLGRGGVVDASQQDTFCAGTSCIITKIYDQSEQWNDLEIEGSGGVAGADHGADAAALPITVGGHKAYGVYVHGQTGYRDNDATGTAISGMPEDMYMVASGTHVNDGCCFDYGNVETSSTDTGNGHMDAVNLSTTCYFQRVEPCRGSGPWVEADLENGLFLGANGPNAANTGNRSNFVTALLKNDGQEKYALKGGDSQAGGLTTWWNGSLPTNQPGYKPMQQEGAVVMGTGGDNSNWSFGSFFEGAMTIGYPTDQADFTVQSNIVQAQYAGNSAGVTPVTGMITGPGGKCVDVAGDDVGVAGAAVQLWDCNGSAADQHWVHYADGTLRTLGRCLDIQNASRDLRGQMEIWDCNGAGAQKWVQQPDGSLLNPASGLCLDVDKGNTTNGVRLQTWTCNGESPQKFAVTGGNPIVGPGGKCVDVIGDDTGGNNAGVNLWDCQADAADQHWRYNAATGALSTLGRCLDIIGNITVEGTPVELYDCNGVQGQVWRQQVDGSLVNPISHLCLDAPNGNTDNGIRLRIWSCNHAAAQKFAAYNASLLKPAAPVAMAGGKCLDVAGDDTGGDGTTVGVWDCLPWAVDQHWTRNYDQSLSTLGRCLDVVGNSSAPGALVELFDCNGIGGQKWVQQPNGALLNPQSGLCLDDPDGNLADGVQLRIWPCNNAAAQRFQVGGGSPISAAAVGGKCVDVAGQDNGTDGTPVQVWDCEGYAADQSWVYDANAGTLKTLGRCLDINGNGTAENTQVELWTCNNALGQSWRQQPDGSLLNPQSGRCLDAPDGNTANGARLRIHTCNGAAAQKFPLYWHQLYAPAGTVTHGSGKCMDVAGNDDGGDGSAVVVWDCVPSAIDQHWVHHSDGSLQTLGKCLDIVGNGTAAGAKLELWTCNGLGGQRWNTTADGSVYNPQSQRCVDLPDNNTTNGTQLQIYDCRQNDTQQWIINGGSPILGPGGKCVDVAGDDNGTAARPVGLWDCQAGAIDQHWLYDPGKETLTTLGRCLGTVGGSTTQGAGIDIGDCVGADAQRWDQQANGSLLNRKSGQCLDAPEGNSTNGTQLRIWQCNGADAQRFTVY
jgi:hypothetical protein